MRFSIERQIRRDLSFYTVIEWSERACRFRGRTARRKGRPDIVEPRLTGKSRLPDQDLLRPPVIHQHIEHPRRAAGDPRVEIRPWIGREPVKQDPQRMPRI